MTTNDNEIVFDEDSGISVDEQREILAHINSIADKQRMSLSAAANDGTGKDKKKSLKPRFKAKKNGSLFPVIVNVAAVVILAAGSFILFSAHGKTDAQVREGTKVYNSVERALIEEIRRETSSRLEEKENEISLITSQLEEIDAELRELHSSNQELTAEQQAAENRLKAMQENYRSTLSDLHDERSLILEEARAREAQLQVQLENRAREFALAAEQSAKAIDHAQGELDRLNREQASASSVEAEIGALFENLNKQISENRFEEAADTIKSTRNFLNTPSFQSLRPLNARKDFYSRTLNSFETMIEEARKNKTTAAAAAAPESDDKTEQLLAEIQQKNTLLEQNLAEKEKTITALSSQGTDTVRVLADKDSQITSLQADLNRQTQVAERQTQLAETTQQTVTAIRTENAVQKRSLDRITEIISGRDIANMSFNEIRESVEKIQEALEEK